jgi:membrane protease YdiL (CAAX protease family)
MNQTIDKYKFHILSLLIFVSFSIMFVFRSIGQFDFWWWMSSNLVIFIVISGVIFPDYIQDILKDFAHRPGKKLLWGLASAIALYGIFYAGNFFSNLLFNNAQGEIASIYNFKGNASSVRIFLLMMVVIGPGEEILWRGIIQRKLMQNTSRLAGFIIATAFYTLVHIFTGNFMLVMAAMVAGIFWGWMYMKYHSIAMNIISHLIWDITIFLLFPIS